MPSLLLTILLPFSLAYYAWGAWELHHALLQLGPPPSDRAALVRVMCIVLWPLVALALLVGRRAS